MSTQDKPDEDGSTEPSEHHLDAGLAGPPAWFTLGDAFRQGHSPGAIATAIEESGVSGLDAYGRLRQFPKQSTESTRALAACARVYEYGTVAQDEDAEHPMNVAAGQGEDTFESLGWRAESVPVFSAEQSAPFPLSGKRQTDLTKTNDKQLVIIAALLRRLKHDWRLRGAAPRVREIVEAFGLTMTDATIQSVLDTLDAAVERRQK